MGNVFGEQIKPQAPTSLFNTAYGPGGSVQQQQFLSNLATSSMGQGPGGEGGLGRFTGLPGYTGQLTPDMSTTGLPQVQANWQPWDAGTQYMANMLSQPGFGSTPPQFSQAFNNMSQYGVQGGYPGQLMHNMAQFGGTGGPGNMAMSNMLQFGVPSAGVSGMADIANKGTTGSWGMPLQSMAFGGQTPAAAYLAPFMSAAPYKAGWR